MRYLIVIALLCASHSMGQVKPVWSDEFDVDGLPDPAKWTYDVGGHGWGNRELQFYTGERLENTRVKDGRLIITARREDFSGKNYTSARLVSKGEWRYGYIEIRAKLPKGKGTWPALWMLPSSRWKGDPWPLCGEIDIMEHVGYDPGVVHAAIHTKAYNHVAKTQKSAQQPLPTAMEAFHIYALDWRADSIEVFVDGKSMFKFANEGKGREAWPFDAPFRLLMNIAVGGNWGGREGVDETAFPAAMEIDYVRVYEQRPEGI